MFQYGSSSGLESPFPLCPVETSNFFLKSLLTVTIVLPLFYILSVFFGHVYDMLELSFSKKDRTCTPVLEGEVLTSGPPEKSH